MKKHLCSYSPDHLIYSDSLCLPEGDSGQIVCSCWLQFLPQTGQGMSREPEVPNTDRTSSSGSRSLCGLELHMQCQKRALSRGGEGGWHRNHQVIIGGLLGSLRRHWAL